MKLILILLLLPAVAVACPKGTESFKDTCVSYDSQPYFGKPVEPSDEKPPSDKMPSYQREGVHALILPTVPEQDAEWIRKRDSGAKK